MSMQRRAKAATERGARRAESLFRTVCTVYKVVGRRTDPNAGVVSDVLEEVYAGRCKVQGRMAAADTPVAGGHLYIVEQLTVQLPSKVRGMRSYQVHIDASDPDPNLAGQVLRLTEMARGSYRTAARWNAELVTA